MKLIAHRGLVNGPDSNLENLPGQILLSLQAGYDCEIDVHLINNELYLGHDAPTYKITVDFLLKNQDKLWIHCKNMDALCFLNGLSTQIYDVNHKGGFENSSELKYQVFLSKKVNTFCYFNKKNNWNIKNVKDISICHFGTIHNNIITKNNNKMAIQG